MGYWAAVIGPKYRIEFYQTPELSCSLWCFRLSALSLLISHKSARISHARTLDSSTCLRFSTPALRMSETPFRPREQLFEKQKFFQSVHKHTYLKGPYDKITSVAIPMALAGSALFLIGRGIYNMSHGIGKKE